MAMNQRTLEVLEFFHPRTLVRVILCLLFLVGIGPFILTFLFLFGIFWKLSRGEKRTQLAELKQRRRAGQRERSLRPVRAKRMGELMEQFPELLGHTRTYDRHQNLLAGREAALCVDDEMFVRMAQELRPNEITRRYSENGECDVLAFSIVGGLRIEAHPSIWVSSPVYALPRKPYANEGDWRNEVWAMQWPSS